MPFKDKEQAKQYAKEAMRKKRGNVIPAVIPSDVIPKVSPNVIPYPAIIHALTDPKKRLMLERVNIELQKKGLGASVTYGAYGPDFNVIDEMLKATG